MLLPRLLECCRHHKWSRILCSARCWTNSTPTVPLPCSLYHGCASFYKGVYSPRAASFYGICCHSVKLCCRWSSCVTTRILKHVSAFVGPNLATWANLSHHYQTSFHMWATITKHASHVSHHHQTSFTCEPPSFHMWATKLPHVSHHYQTSFTCEVDEYILWAVDLE